MQRYAVKKLRIFLFLFWNTMNKMKRTFQIKRLRLRTKSISSIHLNPKTKRISSAGNRTPVSRVTGGDTHHYTTEELGALVLGLMGNVTGNAPSHFKVKKQIDRPNYDRQTYHFFL